MRTRKLLVVLAGLAVLLAAGAVAVGAQIQPNRISRENFDRICEGMSRLEVEAILGPPGDYRTKPFCGGPYAQVTENIMLSSFLFDEPNAAYWYGDGIYLLVFYREEGRVHFAEARHIDGSMPSTFDTWKWRLTRVRHRWFPE